MHFECWLCAKFSPNTHLLVLNHWCSLSFLFTLSYFLSVYIHTHLLAVSAEVWKWPGNSHRSSVHYMKIYCHWNHRELTSFFSLLILLSPVGNRIKGFRSFGERHRMISFENVMNLIYLSVLFPNSIFLAAPIWEERRQRKSCLCCAFFSSQQLNPSSVLPDRNSFRTFW